MNLYSNGKTHNTKDTKSNAVLFVIALICAIASWLIIAMKMYPSASKQLYNIPVSLDVSGTSAAENGLQVLSPEKVTVNISFDCSRTDFSKLTNDNVIAYVDFSNIDTIGSRELKVEVKSKDGSGMSNIRCSPSTIKVYLDKFETKTIQLKPKLQNLKTVEGMSYYDDEVTCTPDEIKITGPSQKLAKIAECYVVSNKDVTLDRESDIAGESFQILDENGTGLDDTGIKFGAEAQSISMHIPVRIQKTVKLDVSLGVWPENFDPDCLDFTITPESIPIAAKDNESNIPDTLTIPIRLSALDIGYSWDTEIDKLLADSNLKNISGIDKINVTLNSDGLSSKEVTINCDDIPLTNKPSDNNDYTILTGQVKVKIVGPEDIINELTAKDLSARVNLLGADTSSDQFKYNVTVSCYTYDNVWAVGDKKVEIKKTPKEGKTTQSSTTATTSAN